MPYIKKEQREKFDILVDALIATLDRIRDDKNIAGDLNYVISRIVWGLFDKEPSYLNGNELYGVLTCATAEFYRRKLGPLEDEKIKQNGDLTP